MSWVYSWLSSVWLLLCLTACPCWSITVHGVSGQNVTLSCTYNWSEDGKCEICWMRGTIPMSGCGDEIIATDGDKVVRQKSRRYQLNGDLQKGDASLTIYDTSQKDSGTYSCRVHIPGWFNDKKISVDLVIVKETGPSTEVNTLLPSTPELVTTDPWHNETTHVITTSTSNTSIPEFNKTGKEPTDDMLPVTVVSIVLIFLVFGTAVYLIWKKKRRTRDSLEIRNQNSNISAIYNNTDISFGLDNRSMAVENIYQLDTENEYEQWSG